MLSRKQILSLDRKIRIKSPDHLFDLNFFDSVLYTIGFRASVLSFLIWVAEVPRKNYLLHAGLFFTDSVLFCLFFVLQTLGLLFLCKNLLAILRNSRSSRLSLFPARKNYFIMGTNLANQIMMSYVWREFSSVRGKMIKRFRSVKRSSFGMPPCTPKKYSRRLKRLSLGMPPCIPFSINIINSSFVPLYFYHFMCYVLCLERLAFSFLFSFS